MELPFLIIILVFSFSVLFICYKRNAWDIFAFNSILGIISLFMIGILSNSLEIWEKIINFLGLVATGSAIAFIFIEKNK